MSDICDRLMRFDEFDKRVCTSSFLEIEAAAEILRLRAENEKLRDGVRSTIQERDVLSGENWELRAENEKLRAATSSLVRSLSGTWSAFELSLRREMGNTNYHCVKEKMDEVEALLDLPAAAALKETGDE